MTLDAPPPAYIIQIDALYFAAHEDGMQYAVFANNALFQKGKVKNPDFHWHFGCRGKIGFPLPHDQWQLFVQYLHFHARTRHEENHSFIFPCWTHPSRGGPGYVTEVENLWRLHLGFFDLFLSQQWPISCALNLEPFWGLRIAGIRHKSLIEYFGGTLFPDSVERLSIKNKFFGVGPYFGGNALWNIAGGLNLFSHFGYSLIWGSLYLHQNEKITATQEKANLFDKYSEIRSIIEMALGLQYQWEGEKFCWNIHGGWEAYFLPFQNQQARFVSNEMPGNFVSTLGNLSLQGWMFGFGVSF